MVSPVLVLSACAFLAGTAAGELSGGVLGAAVAILSFAVWWHRRAALWACCACAGAGHAWASWNAQQRAVLHEDVGPTRVIVRIVTAAEPVLREAPWMVQNPAPTRMRMLAQLEDGRRVQISAPLGFQPLPGDCFEIAGELSAWPEKDFAEGLDVRALKGRRGIIGLLTLRAVALAVPQACAPLTWREHIARLQRQRANALLADGGEATAAAILLGDRRGMTVERLDEYAAAGFTHVLSVSGLHVSACALAVFALFRALFGLLRFAVRLPARALALLCTLPITGFYVLLTGAEVPAIRSALMVVSVLVVKRAGAWNALAVSAWLILLFAPESSVEPSFLFSFVSVAAMLLVPSHPAIAANIASWPLSIAFFQQMSWIGLITNFIAVPLSSFGIVLPGLAWLVYPHAWLAKLVGIAGFVLDGLAHATAFGAWDVAIPAVGASYIAAALARLRHRRWAYAVVGTIFLGALPWHRYLSADVELHVLPVGQGDGMVLFGPHGAVAVIDAGGDAEGRIDPGRRVMRPFLLAHGVRTIDCLIITHQHPDHFGGTHHLLQHFSVTRTITNRDVFDCPAFAFDSLRERYEEFGENDNSLVLRLRHRDRTLLLTGDAEALAEDELRDVATDVLKVAHHGSRTSTGAGFLRRAHPSIALISCGLHNQFGHPHHEVLERLQAAGVAVYRTDLHGHLCVTLSDGITVRPFRL